MIILIGSEKGGTGKTTLATNLATLHAINGNDVLLLDTDKQESAANWGIMRDESGIMPRVPTMQKKGKGIGEEIKDLSTRYKDIIIDSGGRDTVEMRSVLLVADRLYVPCKPSQYDLWALDSLDEVVGNAMLINPKLHAFILFSMASPNPRRSELNEIISIIDQYENLKFSGVIIRDRVAFVKTASEGKGVNEYHDPKAISELNQLYDHVFSS